MNEQEPRDYAEAVSGPMPEGIPERAIKNGWRAMTTDEIADAMRPRKELPEISKPSDRGLSFAECAELDQQGSISFEDAERIVRERMIAEVEKLSTRPDANMPYVQFDVTKYHDGIKSRWLVKFDISKNAEIEETLDAALSAIGSPISDEKIARIAELKAELAELEGAK